MNIIASHQSGLVEQLDAEALALAGRGRDSAQRALVYHHVADMLGLAHGFALLAAHGALGVDAAVAQLERTARRAWWRLKRAQRAALAERIATFGDTLRALDAERCSGVLMAYRLAATPGLGGEAARRLDPDLISALRAAQSARGQADARARRTLFDAHQRWAEALFGERLEQAVTDLDWPLEPGALGAAIAAVRIPARDYDRAERSGLARIERRLRASKLLPPLFASNPAQAFFQLQRHIAERRRRAAEGGDVEHPVPDDAVVVAN
jgi:hypothetical protein